MTGSLHPARKLASLVLERFVQVQAGGVHERAIAEFCGCKQSPWMCVVFPQMIGIGYSAVAVR